MFQDLFFPPCLLRWKTENDSWWRFSLFIIILKEEDGWETGVAQSYKHLTQQRGTASPRTPLDERSWAPHSDWLRAASLGAAPFPGCSCQTQASVRIYSRCPEKTPPYIAPSDFYSATKQEILWVWMSVVSPGVFWTCLKSVWRMVVFSGVKRQSNICGLCLTTKG